MSKNKNDNNGEMVEVAHALLTGLALIASVLLGSIAIVLAVKAKKLEDDGHDFKLIIREKLKTVFGLLPFVIALAIYLDYRLPLSDGQKNIYAEQLKKIEREIIEWDKRAKKNLQEFSKIEADQEDFDEMRQVLVKDSKQGEILAIKYKKASSDFENSPPNENQSSRRFKFILIGVGFLVLSFALSFILSSFVGDDPKKGIYSVGSILGWGLYPFIWVGLAPWPLLRKAIGLSGGEKAASSNMRLGSSAKAYLTAQNLSYHVQVIGGSGAGKTNLLKIMIEDRVRRGHSLLFFDFKADIELMDWMTGLATSADRREDLEIISMSDPKMSYAYNPIATGSETEISSQIMNSLNWSEEFYKNTAESGLMIILKVMTFIRERSNRPFNLGHLYLFLTSTSYRMDVIAEANKLLYPEFFRADLRRISEELSTNKKDNYNGLISQISKILNSSAGEIVSQKCEFEEEFNFREAIEKGKIAYLFMNSLKLKETASIMGKMMLQDLMKIVGNIYDDRNFIKRPTTLIIDEFASFATPDFGEFIEKARGAGISIIVAYQSRKSLDHIEESLALKVNENTATKIVFQVQDSEDAEWFCGLVGTKTVKEETHQAEEGLLFGDKKTGMKSVRQVEEFMVHPNVLKRLQTGQALLICNKVDPHHSVMKINKANQYAEIYKRNITLKERPRPKSTADANHFKKLPEEIRPEDLV